MSCARKIARNSRLSVAGPPSFAATLRDNLLFQAKLVVDPPDEAGTCSILFFCRSHCGCAVGVWADATLEAAVKDLDRVRVHDEKDLVARACREMDSLTSVKWANWNWPDISFVWFVSEVVLGQFEVPE